MKRRYRFVILAAAIVAVLVAVRIALPSVIRDQINSRLMALEGYDGHVDDVDLALLRGAYRLDGVRIVKTGADQPTPFFSAERIDLSVEWRNLMRGSLVAEGVFFRPNLNLVQAKTDEESQLGKEVNWAQRLEELFPFRINTVRVHEGVVTFRAPGIQTQDALVAENINAELTNLTNAAKAGEDTFAHFKATAAALDSGAIDLSGSVDPLAPEPTFDVNLSVRDVQLPKVNPWLRRFIKADAESGSFELYVELAAADGRFKGYAKPLMQDVNIYQSGEEEQSPLRRLWEGVVEFAANVFENEQEEQVAARVPFSGTIENPKAGVFEAIVSVVRNAFVGAFARSLEGSISVRDVKRSLKDLSQRSDSKDADEKDEGRKEKDEKDEERRARKADAQEAKKRESRLAERDR